MRTEGQKQSKKQETRLAALMRGSTNAASGALWLRKGDVRTQEFVVEAKWTGKKQYTLQAKTLEDVITEATLSGRIGIVSVSLNGRDYVIIAEDDFEILRLRAQDGPVADS
jgi:hypothetical protein